MEILVLLICFVPAINFEEEKVSKTEILALLIFYKISRNINIFTLYKENTQMQIFSNITQFISMMYGRHMTSCILYNQNILNIGLFVNLVAQNSMIQTDCNLDNLFKRFNHLNHANQKEEKRIGATNGRMQYREGHGPILDSQASGRAEKQP